MKFTSLFAIIAVVSATGASISGGTSELAPINQDSEPSLYNKFRAFKPIIMQKAGHEFSEFTPIAYSQQVVAGMIYTVKYSVGNGETIEAQVFEPLPYTNDPPTVKWVLNEQGTKNSAVATAGSILGLVLTSTMLMQ